MLCIVWSVLDCCEHFTVISFSYLLVFVHLCCRSSVCQSSLSEMQVLSAWINKDVRWMMLTDTGCILGCSVIIRIPKLRNRKGWLSYDAFSSSPGLTDRTLVINCALPFSSQCVLNEPYSVWSCQWTEMPLTWSMGLKIFFFRTSEFKKSPPLLYFWGMGY